MKTKAEIAAAVFRAMEDPDFAEAAENLEIANSPWAKQFNRLWAEIEQQEQQESKEVPCEANGYCTGYFAIIHENAQAVDRADNPQFYLNDRKDSSDDTSN